jgi:hypothetical protein
VAQDQVVEAAVEPEIDQGSKKSEFYDH